MANEKRAPMGELEARINDLRRSEARGRLMMLEVLYAFDRFEERGGILQLVGASEDGKILRAKVEAIRAHLFPTRPAPRPNDKCQHVRSHTDPRGNRFCVMCFHLLPPVPTEPL